MRTDRRIDALWTLPRLPLISSALVLLVGFACNAAGASPEARRADDSRIFVTAVAGKVAATMAGDAATLEPEATVLLPARIVTGPDGTVGLTQAGTRISVAHDTDVEIPAEAVDGNLIARLVQHSGNVFYDVAPRDLGKLRVETPFLVAVIKGTQFNVAVLESSTTISLFEGSLEIRTPDDDEVVQLNAGEIAIRSLLDDAIRVVGMNDDIVALPPAAPRSTGDASAATVASVANDAATVETAAAEVAMTAAVATAAGEAAKPAVDSGAPMGDQIRLGDAAGALAGREFVATVDTLLDSRGNSGVRLDRLADLPSDGPMIAIDAASDVQSGGAAPALARALDVDGVVGLALGAGVDVAGGDAAPPGLDLNAGLDSAPGLDKAPGLDNASELAEVLNLGVDTAVELERVDVIIGSAPGLEIDAVLDGALEAAVEVGAGAADSSLDAGLDLGAALDVGLDVQLDAGVVDVDLGAEPKSETAPAPRGGRGGLLGGLL